MKRLPDTCPGCGRRTAENFSRPKRAGLHCHQDNTDTWRTNCGVIVCACGNHYHSRGSQKGNRS
ncbi:hypothetical protein [Knoellia sp. LjRoot47]|uniref:hypothetical protein n=1 Tax=Knoellia sp. LjRoot47 TaxID=3342330 RepID=UPI003ECF62D6